LETGPLKKCTDCRYYIKERYPYQNELYGKCVLFKRDKENLIFDGKAIIPKDTKYHFASTARQREWMCGANGRQYEHSFVKRRDPGKIMDM